jgi:hypothetical protein
MLILATCFIIVGPSQRRKYPRVFSGFTPHIVNIDDCVNSRAQNLFLLFTDDDLLLLGRWVFNGGAPAVSVPLV